MTTQEIWTIYHDDLKRFIVSKTKDAIIADDILQDTFIRIHNKLHTLKDETKLKSWIFTITRNAIYDHFSSIGKTITIENTELELELEEHEHTEKDCLRGIIKNLPKKYRIPLFLSDIKGMKQQEVADYLNQNLTTTKSQIQRARKMIAEGFIDCCGFVINEKGKLVGEVQEKEDCKVCQ
ncbi:sigma-70 family RNA polymerase sigma factor [Tenacibaculum amylolyticum]|uniref:sigma-70 family RNA polymerase sigma factor n=1 Tax=Tenacibaculum amylolyticum TaxID=104269 RepID=UPI0038946BC9